MGKMKQNDAYLNNIFAVQMKTNKQHIDKKMKFNLKNLKRKTELVINVNILYIHKW